MPFGANCSCRSAAEEEHICEEQTESAARISAWDVLKKAPYATLSMTDRQGRPYAVPVNQAVDEEYHVVYFTAPAPERSGSC